MRQLVQLRKLAELVEADDPDLEMEHLHLEGDLEGMLRRVEGLMDPAAEKGEPSE